MLKTVEDLVQTIGESVLRLPDTLSASHFSGGCLNGIPLDSHLFVGRSLRTKALHELLSIINPGTQTSTVLAEEEQTQIAMLRIFFAVQQDEKNPWCFALKNLIHSGVEVIPFAARDCYLAFQFVAYGSSGLGSFEHDWIAWVEKIQNELKHTIHELALRKNEPKLLHEFFESLTPNALVMSISLFSHIIIKSYPRILKVSNVFVIFIKIYRSRLKKLPVLILLPLPFPLLLQHVIFCQVFELIVAATEQVTV